MTMMEWLVLPMCQLCVFSESKKMNKKVWKKQARLSNGQFGPKNESKTPLAQKNYMDMMYAKSKLVAIKGT